MNATTPLNREDQIRARLAKVEADPNHPHREAMLRTLHRLLGSAVHSPAQLKRFVEAIA